MARATTLTIAFSALVLLAQAQSLAEYPTGAQEALDRDDECLLEGPEAAERCALNAAQLRLRKKYAAAKAAEEAKADAAPANTDGQQQWPFWPSGGATQPPRQAFQQLGTGGCSTVYQKYPTAIASTTGVQSQWDCEQQCTSNWVCQAYEYCGPYSNCQGNCKLFSGSQQVSSSNGYPGVNCYVRGGAGQPSQQVYKQIGQGGCTTAYNQYPQGTASTGQSPASCKAQCDQNPSCGAYEICQGSNCDGNCKWYGTQQSISGANGYPGVSCYTKSQPYAMAEVAEAKAGEGEAKAGEAAADQTEEGAKFWPFGSKYRQVGSGGCATPYNKYPDSYQTLTNVRSAEACSKRCDDSWICQAYEYCSGSNCDGNCKLFSGSAGITTSNSYPGVSCFSKGGGGPPKPVYKVVGSGGCKTVYNQYPQGTSSTGQSSDSCEAQCNQNSDCSAYEYCQGSNCNGNCKWYSSNQNVIGGNGYAGVTCYKKQGVLNLEQEAAVEAAQEGHEKEQGAAASAASAKEEGKWWPFGRPDYHQVGTGGCASADNQYPESMESLTGIESAEACGGKCDWNWACKAYEFCTGSNCHGNCKLFGGDKMITTVNGYPGVACYVKGAAKQATYKAVGTGGCGTAATNYPTGTASKGQTAKSCEDQCSQNDDCGAYEICEGSNCNGNCQWYSRSQAITKANGYPGVTCYAKV